MFTRSDGGSACLDDDGNLVLVHTSLRIPWGNFERIGRLH